MDRRTYNIWIAAGFFSAFSIFILFTQIFASNIERAFESGLWIFKTGGGARLASVRAYAFQKQLMLVYITRGTVVSLLGIVPRKNTILFHLSVTAKGKLLKSVRDWHCPDASRHKETTKLIRNIHNKKTWGCIMS